MLPDARRPDVLIITIREDEHNAVLTRVNNRHIYRGKNRTYSIGTVRSRFGPTWSIAVIRLLEQGPEEAVITTREAIEDLNPGWIMVVGIAGAAPDTEFTLGDVIVATRIHDFTVGAFLNGTLEVK